MDSHSMSSAKNHKEQIASFPREKSCFGYGDLFQYEGFWNYEKFVEVIMEVQENFEATSTDIFLASHMKTGTTWLKALTFAIATRNTFSASPLLTKLPHDCIPHLGVDLTKKSMTDRDDQIPFISTHISYTSLPKSIRESGCKIIYIWRDAKDVFVSLWHFITKHINGAEPAQSIEEAFDQFCQGVSATGPYWDHVLGYWNAKLKHPDKILFLKYEEMKRDTAFFAKQIAEFIGCPFSEEEEENGVVERIISMCSFGNLSNLEVNKTGKHRAHKFMAIDNNTYFRKGEVGDWKNVLTPEMGARLDSIMEQKLEAAGLLREKESISL